MMSGRPIVQCAEVASHAPHFHLFHSPLMGSHPVYASCDGVLPQHSTDLNPTRVDLPIHRPEVLALGVHLGGGEPLRRLTTAEEDDALAGEQNWTPAEPRGRTDADFIIDVLLPEVAKMLRNAEAHYGSENHRVLGKKGQFADIWRKIGPLKRQLWDDIPSTREDSRTILLDLVGHCLLTITMLDAEESE